LHLLLGSQLAAMGNQTSARLSFTAQPWLISLFFDCPQAYQRLGVVCPNATERQMVKVRRMA
jgi:hypothetical protein